MPTLADIDVNQIIAAAQAAAGGATDSVKDMPLIPLWKVRPPASVGMGAPSGAGSSAAADREISAAHPPLAGNANPIWVTGKQQGLMATPEEYATMDAAEGQWMDMSTADRMEFAAAAEKAGLWKKSLGADALFQAWAKSVGWAGKYNHLHQDDKSKWLSPFEAVTKMQIAGMADDDQAHDGFSTETVIQQFNVSQLTSQARQILQNELGRNPTDSEMKAYTAAVNAAARANPQTRSTQVELGPDGMPVQGGDSTSVVTGGVDPQEIIQGMAQGTQESADFKAASMYLPALQQAIGAAIHM